MQILKLDGLCKQYPAFRLENVSFSMEAGTIMGLIGRNGAGKTTTLKSMLHLVHPDAGTVTICGLDMDKDEREIRSRIGFVSGGASYYQRKRLRELTDGAARVSGGITAVFGEMAEGFDYCLALPGGDLRSLNKEMNAALSGRGGGKPPFQMGRLRASKEEIRKFFLEKGFRQI